MTQKTEYEIILADPPWSYGNFRKAEHGASKSSYSTLSDKELAALPMENIAAKNSLLFLWITGPKLDVGIDVLRSWGYKFVSTVFVWKKIYPKGNSYHGTGFWTMHEMEFVLLGRRGKGLPRLRETRGRVKQGIPAQVSGHSQKPPEVRTRILELVGDRPRIELFAREQAEGWDATGYELDGVDIRDFLHEREKE